MELIGKTKNVYERAAQPSLTIWPQKGKMKFNTSAIKSTRLFDSSFGIAYDTNEDETISVYVYEDVEGGIKLPATGNVTSKYHARRIWDTLTDIEDVDHNTSVELQVSPVVHNDERYPGMDFYELTYAAREIEAESAVEEEAEILAAGSVQEVDAIPEVVTEASTNGAPMFNLQGDNTPNL